MNQPDLFAWPAADGKTDTSREAAKKCRPEYWRRKVYLAFQKEMEHSDRGMSADECADFLGASILTVRPRVTELFQRGYLWRDDEQRRRNRNGNSVGVYRFTQSKAAPNFIQQ